MDLELQTLERRWRQTGVAEDESRWLAARVRAGELPRERLLFAADLGHPAALLALDRPVDVTEAIDFLRAADPSQRALGRLGRAGLVRVGLAALELQLDLVARHHGPVNRGVAPLVGAVRGWCESPTDVQARVVEHVAGRLWSTEARQPTDAPLLPARRLGEGVTAPLPQAGRAVELALRLLTDVAAVLSAPRAAPPRSLAAELGAVDAPRSALREGYERLLLARVQAAVVPWALGAATP